NNTHTLTQYTNNIHTIHTHSHTIYTQYTHTHTRYTHTRYTQTHSHAIQTHTQYRHTHTHTIHAHTHTIYTLTHAIHTHAIHTHAIHRLTHTQYSHTTHTHTIYTLTQYTHSHTQYTLTHATHTHTRTHNTHLRAHTIHTHRILTKSAHTAQYTLTCTHTHKHIDTLTFTHKNTHTYNNVISVDDDDVPVQCDPLQKDGAAGRLLSLWREKVFILLVQLQSRDLQLHTEKSQLHDTVCDLQLDVQKLQSQLSVVQHNLRDRTAQLELQNLHTQELQEQLSCAVEENTKLKEQKENRERSFSAITDTAHRVSESVGQCAGQMDAAQCRMDSLAQRLSFATKRLDTVHGLLLRREALRKAHQASRPPDPAASDSRIERLQSEVALLSSERDALTQELKRTPQLIQNALSDLQQQLEKEVGLLTQALSRSRAELDECELRRLEAQRQCEEREETIAELRTEAHRAEQHCEELEGTITELRTEPHRIQQHWQSLMQEKVSEMERVCDKQLREMETLLNTARREHTKAVVALRQVERTAAREREQDREAERTRSELTHTHITQLHTQLKDKDREWNVLLALVQQHGLMSEYRRMRRAALRIPAALQEEEQHKQQQHNKQQEGGPGL
uniref:Coiled-coil alpha-helical rod protein 1 n=1 Tax=Pygocentrus nattereri TaxID=42514 RepID=A0AAR2M0J1_PYGNA